jgi:hypothetical protein
MKLLVVEDEQKLAQYLQKDWVPQASSLTLPTTA